MLSIIIVGYQSKPHLRSCLMGLRASEIKGPVEIIVVDNASEDGSSQMVEREFPEVALIENQENKGFAAANNQALAFSMGDFILMLNPDTTIEKDTIQIALDFMDDHTDAAICGGNLVNPDGLAQPSARAFPKAWTKWLTLSGLSGRFPKSRRFNGHEYGHIHSDDDAEVDWVPGAFALCRREALGANPFDERFFLYYEETDLCRRLKTEGWSIYRVADAKVVHVGGGSSRETHESFDKGARQIRKFRMRSEWLYFYKNHGFFGVVATAGIEIGWHFLRLIKNAFAFSSARWCKANESLHLLHMLTGTLMETRFGRVSPPRPW